MATDVRNTSPLAATMVAQLKMLAERVGAGSSFHLDAVSTPITAANAVKADYNTHRASTTYHYNADATNVVTSADATDQSSLNTLLNEIKGDFNAHSASGPAGALAKLVDA